MPHKHTRKEKDLSTFVPPLPILRLPRAQTDVGIPRRFDLPPSQIAAPLPVAAPSRKAGSTAKTNNANVGVKRKRSDAQKDDAPRAFKKLMAFASGKRLRSGLDNGVQARGKKQKRPENARASAENQPTQELPTIKPGERMSDFAARVDAALPLGGLVTKTVKDGKDPMGMKVRRTKKEKKMHKLYAEWREEDRKIKERREDELEEAEEKELENEELGISWPLDFDEGESAGKGKKVKKGKGKEEDPWEELKRQRAEAKIGLHDVAQAPPKLQKTVTAKLLVRGGAVEAGDIPKAAGSLRRREELASVRKAVIASYRRRTKDKRPGPQE